MAWVENDRARAQIERILGYVSLGVDGIAVLASRDGRLLASSAAGEVSASRAIATEAVRRGVRPGIQVHWVAEDAALIVSSHPAIACGLVHHRATRAVDLLRRMIVPALHGSPGGSDPFSGAPAQPGLAKRLS